MKRNRGRTGDKVERDFTRTHFISKVFIFNHMNATYSKMDKFTPYIAKTVSENSKAIKDGKLSELWCRSR